MYFFLIKKHVILGEHHPYDEKVKIHIGDVYAFQYAREKVKGVIDNWPMRAPYHGANTKLALMETYSCQYVRILLCTYKILIRKVIP